MHGAVPSVRAALGHFLQLYDYRLATTRGLLAHSPPLQDELQYARDAYRRKRSVPALAQQNTAKGTVSTGSRLEGGMYWSPRRSGPACDHLLGPSRIRQARCVRFVKGDFPPIPLTCDKLMATLPASRTLHVLAGVGAGSRRSPSPRRSDGP